MQSWPLVLISVGLGSFVTMFDGAAVEFALPSLQDQLGVGVETAHWTVTAFLLVATAALLPAGRAGDVLGRARVWRTGMVVFVVGSISCAIAPSLGWLIAARTVQGLGAALVTATAAPLLFDSRPHAGGHTLGLGNVAVALGIVVGLPAGALLTAAFSWRLIFIVAIPFGAAAWLVSRHRLTNKIHSHARIDATSGVLSALGLAGILFAANFGPKWGWASAPILISFAIGVVSLAWFVRRQVRSVNPLVDLGMFSDRTFTSGALVMLFGYAALLSATIALPFFLMSVQRRSPLVTGLLALVTPIGMGLTAPIAGWATDRIGSRLICAMGLTSIAIALFWVAEWGRATGLGWIALVLAIVGVGTGAFDTPNEVTIFSILPPERLGSGSALISAVRDLGMTLGSAIGGILVGLGASDPTAAPPDRAFAGVRSTFEVSACAALLGVAATMLRRRGSGAAPKHKHRHRASEPTWRRLRGRPGPARS